MPPEPATRALDCRISALHGHASDNRRPAARVARPDRRVAELAAAQHGVVAIDELYACGLSRKAVSHRSRTGHLHRLHHGIYAVGHANPPLPGRWLAAVKACGEGAVLSHFSAAALWEIVTWDDRFPEVTVEDTTPVARHGLRVHRTIALARADRATRDGIPVTAPARTLVDLAAQLPYPALRRAVRQAQALRLVDVTTLLRARARLGPRRGAAALGRVLATGPAPTRSELEDAVLDLILRGGLAHPDVNVPLRIAGRRVVPDLRWPAGRLVVEADGARWHDDPLARADDAERQALLEAHGERVLRVTWQQAVDAAGRDARAAPCGRRTSRYLH